MVVVFALGLEINPHASAPRIPLITKSDIITQPGVDHITSSARRVMPRQLHSMADTKTARRQNHSCDQCRRSKKACDGYMLNCHSGGLTAAFPEHPCEFSPRPCNPKTRQANKPRKTRTLDSGHAPTASGPRSNAPSTRTGASRGPNPTTRRRPAPVERRPLRPNGRERSTAPCRLPACLRPRA